jgi:single-strand DNA-binding protein
MLNEVNLIGHVGKDPQVKTLDGGQNVANFSMAMTERFKDKSGEKKEKTEWVNCTAWGTTADLISKYVHKGSLLHVKGKLVTRNWESEGVKKYATEVSVQNIIFLDKKPAGDNNYTSNGQEHAPEAPTHTANANQKPALANADVDSDDLPF